MKKIKLLVLAVFLILVAASASAAEPAAKIEDYMAIPYWLQSRTVPQVMMVLERDWKLFYPAYNNLTDLDGDAVIDIGFNPEITYVGYFDSDSCYTHDDNMFKRVGPTDKTQTASELQTIVREKGDVIWNQSKDTDGDGYLDAGIRVPRTNKHGVCDRKKAMSDGSGQWHGNWLNFATTSRIDAIRKVLYGGKRSTDTAAQTVLELTSFLPGNSHSWGGELVADDLWHEYAKSSPWYDIPSYTGYTRPESKKMHFWARSSYYTPTVAANTVASGSIFNLRSKSQVPLLQFAANIPSTNWHPIYKTPLRIWDWVGDHGGGSLPHDEALIEGPVNPRDFAVKADGKKLANQATRRFLARVQVCEKNNLGLNEDCRQYGNSFKPIGLLQKYGESGNMYFGLLTGSIHSAKRWEGGVVRHHVQAFDNYVNYADGTIKRPGLIDTIDRFTITGINGFNVNGNASAYTDGTQAGNPLGEMVYEAVRYLARNMDGTGLSPTQEYSPGQNEVPVPEYNYPANSTSSLLPIVASWAEGNQPGYRPILGKEALNCPKPVVLLLSEIFTDHDLDTFPNTSQLNNTPRLKPIDSNPNVLPSTFSINAYLDLITKQEKLTTALSGGKNFFFPNQPRGTCIPGPFTGLKDINGHCPSEASLEGGYSLAAVAYYGHTHDVYNLKGQTPPANSNYIEKPIDLFAVGIPGNFPDITFAVDDQRSLTLMPITVAHDIENTKLRTLVNFYVESWEVDVNKRPFRVKFATNFEYNTTPAWVQSGGSNNMERDVFNKFDIILLTDKNTPIAYRETVPVFINSGPFKTIPANPTDGINGAANTAYTDLAASWYTQRDNNSFDQGNPNYYYAFKNPNPNDGLPPLDITNPNFKIVGVAIQNATLGSFVNMVGHGGYTISGVTRPGAYIEAGYNGADNTIVCNGNNNPIVLNSDFRSEDYNCGPCAKGQKTLCGPANDQLYNMDTYIDPGRTQQSIIAWNARYGVPPGYRNPGVQTIPSNDNTHYYRGLADDLATPWECPYANYKDNDILDADEAKAYPMPLANRRAANVCGKKAVYDKLMRYVQTRSFKFDTNATKIAKLPNPLWLAAKYGGFKDSDDSRTPNIDSEWMRGGTGTKKDDPYNYFGVENMSELPDQLGAAFEAIANSVATGTANAASINTVLGGGISIQTQYHTEYEDPDNKNNKLKWVGSVFGLFVDKWGNLREDTNGDGKLNLKTGPPNSPVTGDLIVHMVPPALDKMEAPKIFLCRDPNGDNLGDQILPDQSGEVPSAGGYPPESDCQPAMTSRNTDAGLDELATVWNAAQQISSTPWASRKIYTYYGSIAPDGKTDWSHGSNNLASYPFDTANFATLKPLMAQASDIETKELIEYILGNDNIPRAPDTAVNAERSNLKYRNRTATLPWGTKGAWTLGDIINSKPLIVGVPGSNFDFLYQDDSYAAYKAEKASRRQVAYFGANDGMVHAINLGYFGSLTDGQAGYQKKLCSPGDTTCDPNSSSGFPLGKELWAFIPPSVLPHLQWLADPDYTHGYFVDLKPYIVDVKVNDTWRTIMIIGLRLGGRTIGLGQTAKLPWCQANDTKCNSISYSEFFALDVTDPENTPTLLWRYSSGELGLTTASPTIVRQVNDWYVILPSGPTSDFAEIQSNGSIIIKPDSTNASQAYDGRSTGQSARLVVLNALTGQFVRTRDLNPGVYPPDPLIAQEPSSFFNDTFTPMANAKNVKNGAWSHHAIYLGMTAGKGGQDGDVGAVYRLQMADENTGNPLNPNNWKLKRLIKTDKPVTGAVNSAYDVFGNLWVVFGTGRMWGTPDLIPCGATAPNPETSDFQSCCQNHDQYIYGVKEELNASGGLRFSEVGNNDLLDVSGTYVFPSGALKQGSSQIPETYDELRSKLMDINQPVKGYKRKLESWKTLNAGVTSQQQEKDHKTIFEMVITQPKIDPVSNGRSNLVFTSYQTSNNICNPTGEGYLNVVDLFTGLPAPYMAGYAGFAQLGLEAKELTSSNKEEIILTGTKQAGVGMPSEAWVLKTGKRTVYGNTSFNSNRNRIVVDELPTVGFISWREVMDMGFDLKEGTSDGSNLLFKDLLE